MKYAQKIILRVTATVIGLLALFSLMVVAFFAAMDSANIYVVATDGMKARAAHVITGEQTALSSFFTSEYIQKDSTLGETDYKDFVIRDFVYHISINSLWCNPWSDKATVEITESIPSIAYVTPEVSPTPSPSGVTPTPAKSGATPTPTPEATEPAEAPKPPQWPRARYKLTLLRQNDVWLISDIKMVKPLEPEPTATPEPTLPGQPGTTPSNSTPTPAVS